MYHAALSSNFETLKHIFAAGLTGADQRITEDVEKFSAAIADLYGYTFKPLLDVLLFTRSLSRIMGYKGQARCLQHHPHTPVRNACRVSVIGINLHPKCSIIKCVLDIGDQMICLSRFVISHKLWRPEYLRTCTLVSCNPSMKHHLNLLVFSACRQGRGVRPHAERVMADHNDSCHSTMTGGVETDARDAGTFTLLYLLPVTELFDVTDGAVCVLHGRRLWAADHEPAPGADDVTGGRTHRFIPLSTPGAIHPGSRC